VRGESLLSKGWNAEWVAEIPWTTSFAPAAARLTLTARPIPDEAPVTSTTLPSSSTGQTLAHLGRRPAAAQAAS